MARRLPSGCYAGDPLVRIRYFVVPNNDRARGGFCPVYRVNNERRRYDRRKRHVQGHTFCRGYGESEALRHARAMAQSEAERWGGDYCVTVESSARGTRGLEGARRKRR